ncbi:TNF receptor-associated factor 4-like [Oopsacas minuta]|uniref:TNF receptor-associated factor 4-like n=1 Tax=Oopsacas minuta TaxID=111878 RepID=A0AAV7K8W1_9METZ|nr:TNF receptor-associated factor 4-like [Oopsacas minuta]
MIICCISEKDGTLRGYKLEFLKEEIPHCFKGFVICTICEGIMRDACGVGKPQVFMCAVCANEKTTISLPPNRNVIHMMVVYCPLKSRGCGWEGTLQSADTHLDECGYFHIGCELSCGIMLERSEMETHLTKYCPFREIVCEYCSENHKETNTNLHLETCIKLPIQCSNECGVIIERIDMENHIEETCPNTRLDCEYKKYGCDVIVLRNEVDKHKLENRLMHIELIMQSGMQKQTEELDKVNQENESIKQQLELVIEKNESQKTILCKLTEDYYSLKDELNELKAECKKDSEITGKNQGKFLDETFKPLVERVELVHRNNNLLQAKVSDKINSDKIVALTSNCMDLQYLTVFQQKKTFKLTEISERGWKCLFENWEELKSSKVRILTINYDHVSNDNNELVVRFTGRFSASEYSNATVNICVVLLNNTRDIMQKIYRSTVKFRQDDNVNVNNPTLPLIKYSSLLSPTKKTNKIAYSVLADIPMLEIRKEGVCINDCIYIQVYYD